MSRDFRLVLQGHGGEVSRRPGPTRSGRSPPRQSGPPSQKRILPLFSRTMFIGTTGCPYGVVGRIDHGAEHPAVDDLYGHAAGGDVAAGVRRRAVIVWLPSATRNCPRSPDKVPW